jgi:hypothetical protein
MTFMQKFIRAVKKGIVEYSKFNSGMIKCVEVNVNICHRGKRLYYTLRSESRLTIPLNENKGYTEKDIENRFSIVVHDSRLRQSGYIFSKIMDIHPEAHCNEQINSFMGYLEKEVKHTAIELQLCSKLRLKSTKHFKSFFKA